MEFDSELGHIVIFELVVTDGDVKVEGFLYIKSVGRCLYNDRCRQLRLYLYLFGSGCTVLIVQFVGYVICCTCTMYSPK